MVYKATLKRRVGMEVFDNEKTLKPEEPGQVVAVKELQGNSNHDGKSCIDRFHCHAIKKLIENCPVDKVKKL